MKIKKRWVIVAACAVALAIGIGGGMRICPKCPACPPEDAVIFFNTPMGSLPGMVPKGFCDDRENWTTREQLQRDFGAGEDESAEKTEGI